MKAEERMETIGPLTKYWISHSATDRTSGMESFIWSMIIGSHTLATSITPTIASTVWKLCLVVYVNVYWKLLTLTYRVFIRFDDFVVKQLHSLNVCYCTYNVFLHEMESHTVSRMVMIVTLKDHEYICGLVYRKLFKTVDRSQWSLCRKSHNVSRMTTSTMTNRHVKGQEVHMVLTSKSVGDKVYVAITFCESNVPWLMTWREPEKNVNWRNATLLCSDTGKSCVDWTLSVTYTYVRESAPI